MKRLIGALMLVLAAAQPRTSQNIPTPTPAFEIQGPTIVAFFPPMTDADLDADPDMNEVLSDFQLYVSAAKGPLQKSGVDFQVATARSFEIRIGTKVRLVQTGRVGIGYYFVALGKKAYVQYGVMTDAEILETAAKYFGIPIGK
jgi:hypothetical protein